MPSDPVPNHLQIVIRPPGREPYAIGLEQLTAHVRAYRVLRMGRLAATLAKANDAIASVEVAADHHVEKIIERTKEVRKKLEAVALNKHMRLDGQMSDLIEFDKDLDADLKNDRGDGGANTGNAYTGTGGENN